MNRRRGLDSFVTDSYSYSTLSLERTPLLQLHVLVGLEREVGCAEDGGAVGAAAVAVAVGVWWRGCCGPAVAMGDGRWVMGDGRWAI